MLQLVALRVQQPRGTVQADGGLAGAGAALDHERRVRIVGDQPVLVGLDRGDDVPHVHVAPPLELFEQEVADRCTVHDRPVERLVGDVEQPASVGAEAPAQRHPVGILRRRRVERSRSRRLPVDDELPLLVVVHPAPAHVQRARHRLEVEPAEAEPAFRVLERVQALRRPCVHCRLRDLAVHLVAGGGEDIAHPLEVLVGAVDVRLLGGQLGMAHGAKLPAPGPLDRHGP